MTRPRIFPNLFYRQWLNSIGIPLVCAVLLLVSFPGAVTVLLLVFSVLLLLFLTRRFGKRREGETGVSLLLAAVGISVALLVTSLAFASAEKGKAYAGESVTAEGYVVFEGEGFCDIRTISLDGSPFLRRIRVNEAIPQGSRVVLRGTASSADSDEERRDGVFLCLSESHEEIVGQSYWYSFLASFKNAVKNALGEGREADFLKAVLLGDRTSLDEAVSEDFRLTASSHLLAISGLHITLLVGMVHCLMDLVRTPRPWRRAILFPVVILLYFVTGGSVSVFRAGLMTLSAAAASFCKRRGDSVTFLVLAASLIALQNPFAVTSLSFLFSFTSTFAIVTVASPLCSDISEAVSLRLDKAAERRLLQAAASLATGLVVAASVFVFSLPVNLLVFGEVQALSPLYAVILIPLFAPCLAVGILLVVGLLLPFKLPMLCEGLRSLVRLYLDLISLLAKGAPEPIAFGNFALPTALVLFAVLFLFTGMRRKLRDFLLLYAVLTALLLPMLFFA